MPPAALRLPSIDGLRAFETAARLGSFERAAEALNITASAVSKRVSTLEELLGASLFTRGPKALALTVTGKEYLAQVGTALELLTAAPLHQRAAQRTPRLRVRATPTFARQILVPHLEAFTAVQPTIELELVLSIPYLEGPNVEADLEVRFGDPAAAGCVALMNDRVLPVAAPALLARLPTLRVPVDLLHAPLLRTPLEPWAPWFAAAALDWPEPARGTLLVDLGLTLEAAVSAQGVALVRPSLARHWIESGALTVLPFGVLAQPRDQYHLLPHLAAGAAATFAGWLAALCARLAGESLALVTPLSGRR